MTIENNQIVDGIGLSKTDGKLVMVISDHLDWTDLPTHMKILAAKIECYVAFATGGGIDSTVTEAQGREKIIELLYEHEPSHAAMPYLQSIRDQLAFVGFEFTYRGLPFGY